MLREASKDKLGGANTLLTRSLSVMKLTAISLSSPVPHCLRVVCSALPVRCLGAGAVLCGSFVQCFPGGPQAWMLLHCKYICITAGSVRMRMIRGGLSGSSGKLS